MTRGRTQVSRSSVPRPSGGASAEKSSRWPELCWCRRQSSSRAASHRQLLRVPAGRSTRSAARAGDSMASHNDGSHLPVNELSGDTTDQEAVDDDILTVLNEADSIDEEGQGTRKPAQDGLVRQVRDTPDPDERVSNTESGAKAHTLCGEWKTPALQTTANTPPSTATMSPRTNPESESPQTPDGMSPTAVVWSLPDLSTYLNFFGLSQHEAEITAACLAHTVAEVESWDPPRLVAFVSSLSPECLGVASITGQDEKAIVIAALQEREVDGWVFVAQAEDGFAAWGMGQQAAHVLSCIVQGWRDLWGTAVRLPCHGSTMFAHHSVLTARRDSLRMLNLSDSDEDEDGTAGDNDDQQHQPTNAGCKTRPRVAQDCGKKESGAGLLDGLGRSHSPQIVTSRMEEMGLAQENGRMRRLCEEDVRVAKNEAPSFYGRLVVLGYREYRVHGSMWDPVGSRNDSFLLERRNIPNGIRLARAYTVKTTRPATQSAFAKSRQSYTRLSGHSPASPPLHQHPAIAARQQQLAQHSNRHTVVRGIARGSIDSTVTETTSNREEPATLVLVTQSRLARLLGWSRNSQRRGQQSQRGGRVYPAMVHSRRGTNETIGSTGAYAATDSDETRVAIRLMNRWRDWLPGTRRRQRAYTAVPTAAATVSPSRTTGSTTTQSTTTTVGGSPTQHAATVTPDPVPSSTSGPDLSSGPPVRALDIFSQAAAHHHDQRSFLQSPSVGRVHNSLLSPRREATEGRSSSVAAPPPTTSSFPAPSSPDIFPRPSALVLEADTASTDHGDSPLRMRSSSSSIPPSPAGVPASVPSSPTPSVCTACTEALSPLDASSTAGAVATTANEANAASTVVPSIPKDSAGMTSFPGRASCTGGTASVRPPREQPPSHKVTLTIGSKVIDGQTWYEHVNFDYCADRAYDMFQIGRMMVAQNDFVVRGPLHMDGNGVLCGPVSRYACRIVCSRLPPYECRILAAGFNDSREIFLSENAPKWKNGGPGNTTTSAACGGGEASGDSVHPANDSSLGQKGDEADLAKQWDALTTFGVRVWQPSSKQWFEISVGGHVHLPRGTLRSAGPRVQSSCVLEDGCIIDLAGIQLLFQSAESILNTTAPHVAAVTDHLNMIEPQCPVLMHTIRFEHEAHLNEQLPRDRRPYVFVACGHVHAFSEELRGRPCPLCRTAGPFVPLLFEWVPPLCSEIPTHVLNPCGHILSEAAAKHWASTPLPDNAPPTARYRPICPFCARPLRTSTMDKPYSRLIFQGRNHITATATCAQSAASSTTVEQKGCDT